MQHKRLNHLLDFSDYKPNSTKLFSLDLPCIAPVMASAALYWTDSRFHKNINWKLVIDYIVIINKESQKRFVDS